MINRANNSILWTATDFSLPEILWQRLETMGYKVLVADSSMDIADKIQSLSPRLWVGQVNGNSELFLSQLKEIKDKFPSLSVILMTSRPRVEDAIAAIKLGAADYLTGNITPDLLWTNLEGALKYRVAGMPNPVQPKGGRSPSRLIASQASMIKIMEMAKRIAPTRSTVLIKGETGVGKEVMARFIHDHGDRKDGPFIAVNCAALPESLLESELFGHEKGAFTGAVARKKGKFELAHGGTLLLDEISETAVSMQAKLLRVLQEREIDRVGGQFAVPIDTRVIATTNRDLEAETKNGNFRLDLFYRLNVVPITIPPLRERPDDISPLADFFLDKHCTLNNIPPKRLAPDGESFLKQKKWDGNVREFENLLERAVLLVETEEITSGDLELICSPGQDKDPLTQEAVGIIPLRDMEKKMIFRALDDHSGNRTHAAKVLGISVRTLRNKLHEYEDEIMETGEMLKKSIG